MPEQHCQFHIDDKGQQEDYLHVVMQICCKVYNSSIYFANRERNFHIC